MSTAVYINADDRSNGNVMDEDGEGEVRGATANPPTVDLGILNLDDEDLTLVRLNVQSQNPIRMYNMCDKQLS